MRRSLPLLLLGSATACGPVPAASPVAGGSAPPTATIVVDAPSAEAEPPPPPPEDEKTATEITADKPAPPPRPADDQAPPERAEDDSLGRKGTGPGGGGAGAPIGLGGGGTGEGIGLGDLGTIGHGAGTGSGQGYGSGSRSGASGGKPKMVMGATAVTGSLPPEVVQRVVRQSFGRYRLCYEEGLARNGKLEGRIAVQLVIGKDGAVVSADAAKETTLADAAVVACVVGAVRSLSFPAPDGGGVVTVTYPIELSPSDAASSGGAAPAKPAPTPPKKP